MSARLAAPTFRVELLPALHGDAILIEYGRGGSLRRLLIDGGPIKAYPALRARLLQIPVPRRIDLMVITHVDTDHIEGIVRLLADKEMDLRVNEVWFNGWPQLSPGEDMTFWAPDEPCAGGGPFRSPAQGSVASVRLKSWMRRWNKCAQGRALCLADNGSVPTVKRAGGMRITLLSPSLNQLKKLAVEWRRVLEDKDVSPDDEDTIERRFGSPYRAAGKAATCDWTDFDVKPDDSIANGSSIAFIAEFAGKRCAFLGDAFREQIADAIDRLPTEIERPLRLDVLKTSHHGSIHNISPELMGCIECENFLFSTDGSKYPHPDDHTLELVTSLVPGAHLIFNYASDRVRPWLERASPEGFRASAPSKGESGIVFDVMHHTVLSRPLQEAT